MTDPRELLRWILEAMRSRSRAWVEMRDLPGAPAWIMGVKALFDEEDAPELSVKLVTPCNDADTWEAIRLLEELPGIQVEVAYCPESVREWFRCPFMRCGDGQTYFGLDGIKFFIKEYQGGE